MSKVLIQPKDGTDMKYSYLLIPLTKLFLAFWTVYRFVQFGAFSGHFGKYLDSGKLNKLMKMANYEQEVGRFTGSNYGVLKVIFENNLKLFKQEGYLKTRQINIQKIL